MPGEKMDLEKHTRIILRALEEYRRWFGSPYNVLDKKKVKDIDSAIDAVLEADRRGFKSAR